jgi:hypothetical protein
MKPVTLPNLPRVGNANSHQAPFGLEDFRALLKSCGLLF